MRSFEASAPGSLMLLGEYAVLYGYPALVCAIDKRINVILTQRSDNKINIKSSLGEYSTEIKNINIEQPFKFVLSVLKSYADNLPYGFDIEISSEFSHKVGFASSAAVTVATLLALHKFLNINLDSVELIEKAKATIVEVQGRGSGADVAACVLGGIVNFTSYPLTAEKINFNPEITVIYSGFKTKTPEAISKVTENFKNRVEEFDAIINKIGNATQDAISSAKENNLNNFAKAVTQNQKLMQKLGVNTHELDDIINSLNDSSYIAAAKISGSGFGDCAVGFGKSIEIASFESIPVKISKLGAQCEQI